MKKALISPNEPRETGYRVAQVSDAAFEVASPLFWIDCDDTVTAETHWYCPVDQVTKLMPVMEEPEA